MQGHIRVGVTFDPKLRTHLADRLLHGFSKRVGVCVEMDGDGTALQSKFAKLGNRRPLADD